MKKGCLGCLGFIVVILVLGGIISAIGGGGSSSMSTSSSSSSAAQEEKVKTDGLTYEKFVSLQMGATVEDVNKIIGKEGTLDHQNQVGDIETKSYSWHDGLANMTCMFQNGKMVSKAMASFSDLVKIQGDDITLDQFNQIQMGTSYEDVSKILGREGLLSAQTSIVGQESTIYTWMNKGGANLSVTFQNGAATMKNQIGLK